MSLLFFLKPHYRPRIAAYIRNAGTKRKRRAYRVDNTAPEPIAEPLDRFDARELLARERAAERTRRRKRVEKFALMKLSAEGII